MKIIGLGETDLIKLNSPIRIYTVCRRTGGSLVDNDPDQQPRGPGSISFRMRLQTEVPSPYALCAGGMYTGSSLTHCLPFCLQHSIFRTIMIILFWMALFFFFVFFFLFFFVILLYLLSVPFGSAAANFTETDKNQEKNCQK